jgi:hypothetical protein
MGAAQDAGNHWRSAGRMSALRLRISHPTYFALNARSSQRFRVMRACQQTPTVSEKRSGKVRTSTVTLTSDTVVMQDKVYATTIVDCNNCRTGNA